jgi:hypothetical protein
VIKPRRRPWPFPADTPLDRARRCTYEYRAALLKLAPNVVLAIDKKLTELGEPWVAPQQVQLDLDATHRPRELSELLGGVPTEETIRQWRSRGHLPDRRDDDGRPVNTPRDVLDHQAAQRRARAERRGA